jgi:hypothetical protein
MDLIFYKYYYIDNFVVIFVNYYLIFEYDFLVRCVYIIAVNNIQLFIQKISKIKFSSFTKIMFNLIVIKMYIQLVPILRSNMYFKSYLFAYKTK